jgi:hypothetical protein
MSTPKRVRVFISYSWDDQAHKDRVLALAQKLRAHGVDAWIDGFNPFPAVGWLRWMEAEIARAKWVLCVATKTYAERFRGGGSGASGLAAAWEGSIVSDQIYDARGHNEKFVPILFDAQDAAHVPQPLRQSTRFHAIVEYEELYRLIVDQPKIIPVDIGPHLSLDVQKLPPLAQPKVHKHRRDRGNLPRLAHFFGRDVNLAQIEAALRPDTRTWVVLIDGPGGIGKTSLAIRAAEVSSEIDYPRVVFVTSKKRELGPGGVQSLRDFRISSYLEILGAVASELGNSEFSKLAESERPRELIRLLREKPALLVIDNLESLSEEDRGRVLEFLKQLPDRSKAIVTSRRRTDVQAEIIRLERVEWEDAALLLEELARNSKLLAATGEADRRRLYVESGGNPLILAWIAGQLGRGRCRTVASAIDLLKASPAGEEALEFIFGDLLDSFTSEEMGLVIALSLFHSLTAVRYVAELSGLAPLAAQAALEELTDRSLVISDAESKNFTLGPLVGDYLRRARPIAVRETEQRLVVRMIHLSSSANTTADLEMEWHTIESGLQLLSASDNQSPKWRTMSRLTLLCTNLRDFLDNFGHWDELKFLYLLAEDEAIAQGDFSEAGWYAYVTATVFDDRGDEGEFKKTIARMTSHWNRVTNLNRRYKVIWLTMQASIDSSIDGNLVAACEKLIQARSLLLDSPNEQIDLEVILGHLAVVQHGAGDEKAAESTCREAICLGRILNNETGIAVDASNLARWLIEQERYDEAALFTTACLLAAEKAGNVALVGYGHHLRALLALEGADPVTALQNARRAVELLRTVRSKHLKPSEATLQECQTKVARLQSDKMT